MKGGTKMTDTRSEADRQRLQRLRDASRRAGDMTLKMQRSIALSAPRLAERPRR